LGAEAGLPISPAHQTLDDVANDPQIVARAVFVNGAHPIAGQFDYVGSAARVDGENYRVRRHAPAPGEHTREVLDELSRRPGLATGTQDSS
jgi:crotonobetainyl-CoA:carnitine CoA-transferase CaiB-like acyl-CoA transferase